MVEMRGHGIINIDITRSLCVGVGGWFPTYPQPSSVDRRVLLTISHSGYVRICKIRYDAMQYDTLYLRALKKLITWPASSSARHKNEKIRKNSNQNPSSSEETVRVKVREGSPGGKFLVTAE